MVSRSRQNVKKTFLKIIQACWYLAALVLVIIFFLKDYFQSYLKSNTTFSSRYTEVENVEFPTIIACLEDGYKTQVMKKYNLDTIYDFPGDEQPLNATYKLEDISYNYGVDYDIRVDKSKTSRYSDFKVEEIYTWQHGKCLKLEPREEIDMAQRVQLEFKPLTQDMYAKSVILYLFSNKSWHGLCDDTLPYFNPSKVVLTDLGRPTRIQVALSLTSYEFMNGVSDFSSCVQGVLDNMNCPSLCSPFYLRSLVNSPTIQLCNTYEDGQCVTKELFR